MTPQEYLARIYELVDVERWQEALDFSAATIGEVHPALTFAHLMHVHGIMHVAVNIVNFEQPEARHPRPARG